MKEKRNYKRFELIPVLAMIGCAGVLLFECIFIFERYDLLFPSGGAPSGQPVPSVEIQKPGLAVPPPVSAPQGNSPVSNAPAGEPVRPSPAG